MTMALTRFFLANLMNTIKWVFKQLNEGENYTGRDSST